MDSADVNDSVVLDDSEGDGTRNRATDSGRQWSSPPPDLWFWTGTVTGTGNVSGTGTGTVTGTGTRQGRATMEIG